MTQEEMLALMHSDTERGMYYVTKQYTALVYKVVWGKLKAICTPEDIEEAVSDVFVDFFRNYRSVDLSKGSLATFLIILAGRRSVDILRKVTRHKTIENMLSDKITDISVAAESTVLKNEERQLLLEGIFLLGEPDATIIYRKFFYGETYEEIGGRVGLSANAVNKRYLRAIEKLSKIMKGEIFDD